MPVVEADNQANKDAYSEGNPIQSDLGLSETTSQLAQDKETRTAPAIDPIEPTRKLKKRKTQNITSRFENVVLKLHDIATTANCEAEDQYTVFGHHMASQLRQLPIRSFLIAQEKIQNIITQERLRATEITYNSPSSSCSYQPSPDGIKLPTVTTSSPLSCPIPEDNLSSISQTCSEGVFFQLLN